MRRDATTEDAFVPEDAAPDATDADGGEPDDAAQDARLVDGGRDSCLVAAETCDGVDDDCDGRVDEECSCLDDAHCSSGTRCFEGACVTAPVERTVLYTEAEYRQPHNWVLRCDGDFDYAFTARGSDQIPLDCGGRYAPDGTRRGRAIFRFPNVAPGEYEVRVRSRHSANRNPRGALFVVDGEARRIDQTRSGDLETDVWGTKVLRGDVTVVLDSRDGESDSVTWVRLVPR